MEGTKILQPEMISQIGRDLALIKDEELAFGSDQRLLAKMEELMVEGDVYARSNRPRMEEIMNNFSNQTPEVQKEGIELQKNIRSAESDVEYGQMMADVGDTRLQDKIRGQIYTLNILMRNFTFN